MCFHLSYVLKGKSCNFTSHILKGSNLGHGWVGCKLVPPSKTRAIIFPTLHSSWITNFPPLPPYRGNRMPLCWPSNRALTRMLNHQGKCLKNIRVQLRCWSVHNLAAWTKVLQYRNSCTHYYKHCFYSLSKIELWFIVILVSTFSVTGRPSWGNVRV